jgi:hypothetical protein
VDGILEGFKEVGGGKNWAVWWGREEETIWVFFYCFLFSNVWLCIVLKVWAKFVWGWTLLIYFCKVLRFWMNRSQLTLWHTQPPVRQSEPSMSLLLVLAFYQ